MKARSKHARSKQIASATRIQTFTGSARPTTRVWARPQPDSVKAIWPRRLPLACVGLSWLVLACLARAALFRRACAWKNFSGPKKISPPASFATQYHDKMNFQSLAWWNTWPLALFGRPAPEKKTFRGLCFFPPGLLCNLIPRQNKLLSPGMVEYMAYSSVWNACTWTKKIGA